jgi:hypothetical protein
MQIRVSALQLDFFQLKLFSLLNPEFDATAKRYGIRLLQQSQIFPDVVQDVALVEEILDVLDKQRLERGSFAHLVDRAVQSKYVPKVELGQVGAASHLHTILHESRLANVDLVGVFAQVLETVEQVLEHLLGSVVHTDGFEVGAVHG